MNPESTESQTPAAETTPQAPDSPLGTGENPFAPAEAAPAQPVVESAPEPEPDTITLSKADHEKLLSSQSAVEAIEANPGLMQAIREYTQGTTQVEPSPRGDEQQSDHVSRADFEKMRQELVQQVQQAAAVAQISEFARTHGDFDQHKEEMGKWMNKHPTMTLQEAYDLAKRATDTQQGQQASRPAPAQPEGRQVGSVSHAAPSGVDISKLVDGAPNIRAATEIALKHAAAQHSS